MINFSTLSLEEGSVITLRQFQGKMPSSDWSKHLKLSRCILPKLVMKIDWVRSNSLPEFRALCKRRLHCKLDSQRRSSALYLGLSCHHSHSNFQQISSEESITTRMVLLCSLFCDSRTCAKQPIVRTFRYILRNHFRWRNYISFLSTAYLIQKFQYDHTPLHKFSYLCNWRVAH